MSFRNWRNRMLQRAFWNPVGAAVSRRFFGVARRADHVILNRSLETDTNGERWLVTTLGPRPTAVDVGYYSGDYSREILAQRPEARVIAFDPSRFAQRSYDANPDPRIQFVHAALADAASRMTFHDYGNMCNSLSTRHDAGGEKESYEIDVHTLDAWCATNGVDSIDLLKIDAEGWDLAVLKGASRLLDHQAIKVFQFEYADGWIGSRTFLQDAVLYLQDKPYQLMRLFNGFLTPFKYTTRQERFDLGIMFVGVAHNMVDSLPIRDLRLD